MKIIEDILKSKIKTKGKQLKLVEGSSNSKIDVKEFIKFFKSASDVNKGICADAMKHIPEQKPDNLLPFIDALIEYINYKKPRVKWSVPESISNIAKRYPDKV